MPATDSCKMLRTDDGKGINVLFNAGEGLRCFIQNTVSIVSEQKVTITISQTENNSPFELKLF